MHEGFQSYSAQLACRNNSTIEISKTSEHIVKNGKPVHSNKTQATVATTMTPKETCHCFQNRTSETTIETKERKS